MMKGSRIELETTSLGRASVAGVTISRYPLEAIQTGLSSTSSFHQNYKAGDSRYQVICRGNPRWLPLAIPKG
jgi:hypothetical protein